NGEQLPCGFVQRAPRTQVVVPGGRGPCLPRRAVTSRRRRTPHLAPPSGSSPETPLNERGWEWSNTTPIRSQQKYSICRQKNERPPLSPRRPSAVRTLQPRPGSTLHPSTQLWCQPSQSPLSHGTV